MVVKLHLWHLSDAVGFPVAHVEFVRHDAGTRPEVSKQLGTKLQVQLGKQVKRDDGRLPDIGLEEILFNKLHTVSHARLSGVVIALSNQIWVIVHTHAASAKYFCGCDDDATIPAAKIINNIVLSNPGHFEHLHHYLLGSRNVRDLRRRLLGVGCCPKYPDTRHQNEEEKSTPPFRHLCLR